MQGQLRSNAALVSGMRPPQLPPCAQGEGGFRSCSAGAEAVIKWADLSSLRPEIGRTYGRLRYWDHEKGWGFIDADGGHAWVAEREMRVAGLSIPTPGEYLSFRTIKTRGRIEAVELKLAVA